MTPFRRAACCLTILSFASGSTAQTPPAESPPAALPLVTPPPPASEAPKPIAELTKVQFLVGDWVHDEIDHSASSPGGGRRAARSRIAWILGGHRLYITYKSVGTSGEYEGRGLIGWDAEAKAYRLDWFDSRGAAQRYDGSFDPEETLVFGAEFKAEGERRRQELTIKKQPGGKFLLTDATAVGDGPTKRALESLAQPAPTPSPTPTPAATPTPLPGAATPSPGPTPSPTPKSKQ